jgi:hypothetical protein
MTSNRSPGQMLGLKSRKSSPPARKPSPAGRARAEAKKMSGAPWNTTDTERLRALASAGLSLSEIAIEMERSKQVIRTWAEIS